MKLDGSDHFDPFFELRRRTARVCEHFPATYWSEMRRVRDFPSSFLRSLTQFRLMSLTVPAKFGGAGLGIAAACAVVEEAHRLGCDFGRIDLQYALCFALACQADAPQRRPWMLDIASGHSRLQMSNVFRGGDEFVYQTTTTGARLSGQAVWPERTEHCELALLIAREDGRQNQTIAVVNVGATKGISLRAQWTDATKGQVSLVAKNAAVKRAGLMPAEGVVSRANAAKELLACAARLGDARAICHSMLSKRSHTNVVSADSVRARKVIRDTRAALGRATGLLDKGGECRQAIGLAGEYSHKAVSVVANLFGAQDLAGNL